MAATAPEVSPAEDLHFKTVTMPNGEAGQVLLLLQKQIQQLPAGATSTAQLLALVLWKPKVMQWLIHWVFLRSNSVKLPFPDFTLQIPLILICRCWMATTMPKSLGGRMETTPIGSK